MAGFFNDIIADLDAESFVDSDVFGEPVLYYPRNADPVTINAVVWRDPPEKRDGVPTGSRPKMIVYIRNHATAGRSSIDNGGDRIKLAYRLGGEARFFAVTGPVRQDEGLWVVELN